MQNPSASVGAEKETVERLLAGRSRINTELSKVIVGQSAVIEELLIALFAGGHCLITGAPGLAKTLLIKSIAQIFHLKFRRIQFTPDLMPADITGTEILEDTPEGRRMVFVHGPVFATEKLKQSYETLLKFSFLAQDEEQFTNEPEISKDQLQNFYVTTKLGQISPENNNNKSPENNANINNDNTKKEQETD